MNPILESAKFVCDSAEFVRIQPERLQEFAQTIQPTNQPHWLAHAPFDLSKFNPEEQLHFLLIFNSLSFSYWGDPKWSINYHGQVLDGAWGMIAALGRAIEEGVNILDFSVLQSISRDQFAHLLRGSCEIPLLDERWRISQELATSLIQNFEGRASGLIQRADGDALALVNMVIEYIPSFRDISPYKDRDIVFSKRAQLFVADMHQMFRGQSFGSLRNVDQITACADYKLPQILRKLGIVVYESLLADRVDAKIKLAAHSPEEVEIRAAVIWAVHQLAEQVRLRHPEILTMEVNDALWLATQEKYPDDMPYHRVRTTGY